MKRNNLCLHGCGNMNFHTTYCSYQNIISFLLRRVVNIKSAYLIQTDRTNLFLTKLNTLFYMPWKPWLPPDLRMLRTFFMLSRFIFVQTGCNESTSDWPIEDEVQWPFTNYQWQCNLMTNNYWLMTNTMKCKSWTKSNC